LGSRDLLVGNIKILGIVLVIFGIIYLIKPDLYKNFKGFDNKPPIMKRLLSPERYILYMRTVGGIFIVVGLVLFLK
jgi:hypothetical protein